MLVMSTHDDSTVKCHMMKIKQTISLVLLTKIELRTEIETGLNIKT